MNKKLMTKLGAIAAVLAVGFMGNEVSAASQVTHEAHPNAADGHQNPIMQLREINPQDIRMGENNEPVGLLPIAYRRLTVAQLLETGFGLLDQLGVILLTISPTLITGITRRVAELTALPVTDSYDFQRSLAGKIQLWGTELEEGRAAIATPGADELPAPATSLDDIIEIARLAAQEFGAAAFQRYVDQLNAAVAA